MAKQQVNPVTPAAATFDFTALVARAQADHPDANLVALCDHWLALEDEGDRLLDTWTHIRGGKASAEELALNAEALRVKDVILDTSATTLDGLAAKARVVNRWLVRDADGCVSDPDHQAAASLCDDLLAIAKRAAQ